MLHALLAPSSMARTVQCTASPLLAAMFPDEPTQDSLEGDAAHWLAGNQAKHGKVEIDIAPNDIEITEEMWDGADLYEETILKAHPNAKLMVHIEETIKHSVIHEQCWGTPDGWLWDAESKTLHVFDYKFGHRFVDIYENWQLIVYAILILAAYGLTAEHVVMTIVQPRSFCKEGPVRSWRITKDQLWQYLPGLQTIAAAAVSGGRCKTGHECRDCKARHRCATLAESSYSIADYLGDAVLSDMTIEIEAAEYQLLCRLERLITARRSGLEQSLSSQAVRGAVIPGHMLEQGFGREKWIIPAADVKKLGAMFGKSLVEEKPITPKQAIKAGVPESVVKQKSVTPLGAIKLVPVGNKLKRIFKNE